MQSLFLQAFHALMQSDVNAKLGAVHELEREWQTSQLTTDDLTTDNLDIDAAGRPEKPLLVSPTEVPRRGLGSKEGKAAFVHALAHIEFNAINLALDAVYRFRDMPDEYYSDWIRVAREEAEHFVLLRDRLLELGYDYGDFPAHAGLWDMARRTASDLLLRMALVPRMLEARGLDVTPGMISRLKAMGDTQTAACLEVIYREELGHVDVGSRWFEYICSQRELEPQQTYIDIIKTHVSDRIRKPINAEARRKAGFGDRELDFLEQTTREQ